MMKYFNQRLFWSAALSTVLASCDHDEAATSPMAEEEAPPTNRIEIPATVRRNLGITFAEVERRHVVKTTRVPGSFELTPLARREYRLMLSGRVRLEVDQFTAVEPGTLLFRFWSPEWRKMQSTMDLASAGLERARSKVRAAETRLAALARAGFKRADLETEVALFRAEMAQQEKELETALRNAAKLLKLHRSAGEAGMTPEQLLESVEGRPRYQGIEWIDVHASQAGVVESLAVTDGAFVEEAAAVLTTVDPTKVRFRAMGLQGDLPGFSEGQAVRIVPPQGEGRSINEAVEGTLAIGVLADPEHRTIPLFAHPAEARSWIRPGVSAFLEISAEDSGGMVLAIPRTAVVKDGITHVFFRRDPKDANKAIRVEADLGVDDGRWVEVKSGIGPNDTVVLDGAYELKLASAQSGTSQKGGHFHADGTFHKEH